MQKIVFNGQFRERLHMCWVEIQENLGRSFLQSLAVVLGVASVLGGFSITDSFRRQTKKEIVRMGGMDKLAVAPIALGSKTTPSALRTANLGLRNDDAEDAQQAAERGMLKGTSTTRMAMDTVTSPSLQEDRQLVGADLGFVAMEGYTLHQGRLLSLQDLIQAASVVFLGSEAALRFFPDGNALGQTLKVGPHPMTVVGIYQEKVFRAQQGGPNLFKSYNTLIQIPITFMQKRMYGDSFGRVDGITFRIPDFKWMGAFKNLLNDILLVNHRQQSDFRIDNVKQRIQKYESQENMYDMIFMLSGILAIVGGGIVNINIQLASLKERVREVGVKMAIGANSREVFKEFMLEALLLSILSACIGLGVGMAFSQFITQFVQVPLYMEVSSFIYAFLLAVLSGFLFALYPAWRASKLSPMEALRHE